MRIIFSFTIIILSLCSFACLEGATDQFPPRKLKPYDPKKAGTAIVKKFDITGVTPSFDLSYCDMAEYNGSIYVRFGKVIYVFNKKNMRKTGEITINMPQEYNHLPAVYNILRFTKGLVITGERAFLLLEEDALPMPPYLIPRLFSVDLYSGNAELIDEQTLGFEFSRSNTMGYSKSDNKIWFRVSDHKKVFFYAFIYDNNSKTFTLTDTSDWDRLKINPLNQHRSFFLTSSFFGNEVWSVYLSTVHFESPSITIIDKRYMNDLTESVSQIYVEHLSMTVFHQSIIYDKPYIWMLAERDNQVQMLKLLPKG